MSSIVQPVFFYCFRDEDRTARRATDKIIRITVIAVENIAIDILSVSAVAKKLVESLQIVWVHDEC